MVSAALGSAGACAVGNSERGRGHWGWAVGGGPLETGTGRREENLNAVKKPVFEVGERSFGAVLGRGEVFRDKKSERMASLQNV